MQSQNNTILPKFKGRNVPISEIAQATGKSSQFIRLGIQRGFLTFGYAIKKEGSTQFNYFCPDKRVWEELGYFNETA
ncbi:MAG: hypothetical protein LUD77_12080 [Clostridiales bacterium]|nr:hypothetical protein [Clostridiales bacterium]